MPSHGAQPGQPHDERDAFFRDLRALRAQRGLDLGEIAERTRLPLDMLAAAETGPGLPSLPTLSAYLRGCGEPLASWEDRWQRLASGTVPTVNGLPVRDAGASPLASAGAAVAGTDGSTQPLDLGILATSAQPAYAIKRLGHRRTWQRPAAFRRYAMVAAGAAVALLAVGGAALLAANQAPGHRAAAPASPTPTSPAPTSPARTASPPAQRAPSAGLAPAPGKHPGGPANAAPGNASMRPPPTAREPKTTHPPSPGKPQQPPTGPAPSGPVTAPATASPEP